MGEFNSDDHYIYYYEQKSLRRNEVALIVNKSLKCSTWMQSQKRRNDLCSFPRQTFQYPIILPFHSVHGVLKARILKWFAIPFSSGPHSVRPLHHDPPILGGPTGMAKSLS